MDINRRDALKSGLSALGFLALPGGLFAAPAEWKPTKKPNLVFGILSDTHLMVGRDGKSLYKTMTFNYVRNAFKLFKSRNIDAFVHLGDASHRGAVREWEFHKELFEQVFGKRGGPAKIIVVGNHELFGDSGHCKEVWKNQKDWEQNAICADLPRHYERTWGEPYAETMHKEIKGYHFFIRHWNDKELKDFAGEQRFADYILSKSEECSLGDKKPFFVMSHRRHHFKFCKKIGGFPCPIAFMGHWHHSNADWKSIYCDTNTFGGFFPHMEVGACRFDGHNGMFPPGEIKIPEDSSSFKGDIQPSRQAMIVNVYDDMVVFERHEVGEGGKLGPDWVMPLGWETAKHPFSTEELKKVEGTPEFGKGAKLSVNKSLRGLTVAIPFADGNPDVRPYAYNVVIVGDDPRAKFYKSEYFSGINCGIGHEPKKGVTTVEVEKGQFPAGKNLTIAVRPVTSLGTKGGAIAIAYSTATGRATPVKA